MSYRWLLGIFVLFTGAACQSQLGQTGNPQLEALCNELAGESVPEPSHRPVWIAAHEGLIQVDTASGVAGTIIAESNQPRRLAVECARRPRWPRLRRSPW